MCIRRREVTYFEVGASERRTSGSWSRFVISRSNQVASENEIALKRRNEGAWR